MVPEIFAPPSEEVASEGESRPEAAIWAGDRRVVGPLSLSQTCLSACHVSCANGLDDLQSDTAVRLRSDDSSHVLHVALDTSALIKMRLSKSC